LEKKIVLNKIIINKNSIEYEFSVSDNLRKYFNLNEKYLIEYSNNISDIPESIAVIPFLSNFLPIAWVTNSKIYVEEVDKTFFNKIKDIKSGYKKMYKNINFLGKLISKKLVENIDEKVSTIKSAAFFSGGLDSYATLIRNFEVKPMLITILGSDIEFEDKKGWGEVKNLISDVSKEFGLDVCYVKSSFRRVTDYMTLTGLVEKRAKDNWWHGFQHGIGIIGHGIPICFSQNINNLYIASSFCISDKNIKCASYPTIDNNFEAGSIKTIHDSFELNRQDKAKIVCEFLQKNKMNLDIRVCWESKGGKNCSKCEKCIRTIMGIYSEGYDPREFGFAPDYEYIKNFFEKNDLKNGVFWKPIIKNYIDKGKKFYVDSNVNWIYKEINKE